MDKQGEKKKTLSLGGGKLTLGGGGGAAAPAGDGAPAPRGGVAVDLPCERRPHTDRSRPQSWLRTFADSVPGHHSPRQDWNHPGRGFYFYSDLWRFCQSVLPWRL